MTAGDGMQVAALVLSMVALLASLANARRQIRLSRHSNSVSVLVDLFREHRSDKLARARKFVYSELGSFDLAAGLEALPLEQGELVRDLAWYYDNLGALVLHDIVDIEPVAGYLGGSIVDSWKKIHPLVEAERAKRKTAGSSDPGRWQEYFEYLHNLVQYRTPQNARDRRLRGSLKVPISVRIRSRFVRGDAPFS
jgi:hypothetical protein